MSGFSPLLRQDVDDMYARVTGKALLCVSDIHGDLAAFDAVLRAVDGVAISGIVACGDHCLGGPDPFGVWQRLTSLHAHLVRGPSDLALGSLRVRGMAPRNAREDKKLVTFLRTQAALGDLVCRRLAELPTSLVVPIDELGGVMAMHASPADDYRGLVDDDGLLDHVDCVAEDVLVSGATHVRFARRARPDLLVVNVGSVGLSKARSVDGRRLAHAALLARCDDGLIHAFAIDVDVETTHARSNTRGLLRAG